MTRPDWLPDPWAIGVSVLVLAAILGVGLVERERSGPVEVGYRAPDFAATDLGGRQVSLGDLEGEVVLLNVWATWCPPCREEMPSMQRLYDKLGPEGLRMIAVSIDAPVGSTDGSGRPGGDVGRFVDEYGLTFDVWLDPEAEVHQIYRMRGVPESVIIDRNGLIARKVLGSIDWDTEANIAMIRRLLDR